MEKKTTILIADDELDAITLLSDQLHAEGYETLSATEGVRVIEIAHKHLPDLILLDLKMPAGRGESVLQTLRTQNDTRHIPIIIVTGLDSPGLKQALMDAGAKSVVHKPYEFGDLLSEVQNVL